MKPTANDCTANSNTQPRKKYDSNGKGWYFRSDGDDDDYAAAAAADDDDKMSYKEISKVSSRSH